MTGRHRSGRPPSEPPPTPTRPPPPPPPSGPRRAALDDRRKRARKRAWIFGALAGVVLLAGIAVALRLRDPAEVERGPSEDRVEIVRPESATSTLLAGSTSARGGRSRLVWMSLLVLDPGDRHSAVAFIPALTATEVPGRGPHPLAEAYATGGMPLLALAAENLLGVRVDRHVELTERDARVLFRALAPLEVDVPADTRIAVEDGLQLLIERGTNTLEADPLVAYTFRLGEEGDPASMGPRHLAVWSSLFARGAGDPEEVESAMSNAVGAFERSNDEPEEVAGFLAAFLGQGSEPALRSLPVSPLEVPGDPIYVTDEDEIREFVTGLVTAELLSGDVARVQILNGVGAPGIGQRVARRLVGNGFRVALTGNARSLNHRKTLIITYDTTQEGRDRASLAQELLGVGEVQVSLQEQGIVDLTIVVGRDFLRAQ